MKRFDRIEMVELQNETFFFLRKKFEEKWHKKSVHDFVIAKQRSQMLFLIRYKRNHMTGCFWLSNSIKHITHTHSRAYWPDHFLIVFLRLSLSSIGMFSTHILVGVAMANNHWVSSEAQYVLSTLRHSAKRILGQIRGMSLCVYDSDVFCWKRMKWKKL